MVGELNIEDIGDDGAIAAGDRRPVINFALQSSSNLNRLHLGLKGPGEGAIDHAVEGVLEPFEQTHLHSLNIRGIGEP